MKISSQNEKANSMHKIIKFQVIIMSKKAGSQHFRGFD